MTQQTKHKTCPHCGTRVEARVDRCPRCRGPLDDASQNIVDKASADSFPASDSPSY